MQFVCSSQGAANWQAGGGGKTQRFATGLVKSVRLTSVGVGDGFHGRVSGIVCYTVMWTPIQMESNGFAELSPPELDLHSPLY